jgi:hypothetical protein
MSLFPRQFRDFYDRSKMKNIAVHWLRWHSTDILVNSQFGLGPIAFIRDSCEYVINIFYFRLNLRLLSFISRNNINAD